MENVISLLGMQPRGKFLITGPYFRHFLLKMVKLRKDSIFLREENIDFEMLLFIFSCCILVLAFLNSCSLHTFLQKQTKKWTPNKTHIRTVTQQTKVGKLLKSFLVQTDFSEKIYSLVPYN